MIHQDASRHPWVPGQIRDLVMTMDDATNRHDSMFFVTPSARIVPIEALVSERTTLLLLRYRGANLQIDRSVREVFQKPSVPEKLFHIRRYQ